MGMTLRYGRSVTKKKRKQKKKTFVCFRDQKVNPKRKSVIPTKAKVFKLRIGLEMGREYAAE